MKKLFKIIIVLFISSFSLVFANSGPTYWQGYPSSDIMTIDKNSPISVEGEYLTFNFSHENRDYYSIEAKVTAEYIMNNPTNETQFVQMAFPFVERLNNINYDEIKITADGKELPYDVYLGNPVNSNIHSDEKEKENFDFDKIINTISNDLYIAKTFSADEMGKLYYIEMEPTTDEMVDFTVDFVYNHEKTNILIKNFNSFSRDVNGNVRISSGFNEPQTAEIFILGEDIDFNVKGYTIGSSKVETNKFNYEIIEKEVDVKTYVLDYVKDRYGANVQHISDIQLYNLYAATLDKYFEQNMGFCSDGDIFSESYNERIITLVYDVEFPSSSVKNVGVTYNTKGTMNKRNTVKPQYSFDYILNPAKNWSSFNNLNIKIITPQAAPYIIDSSVEFTKEEGNIYTAEFEKLPEEDLSFTLYPNEKITLLDRVNGRINRSFGYFAPIIIGIIGIVMVIVIVAITRKIKRMKN